MIEQYSRREYLPLRYKLQGIVILNWNSIFNSGKVTERETVIT